jgi:hypothetical protein
MDEGPEHFPGGGNWQAIQNPPAGSRSLDQDLCDVKSERRRIAGHGLLKTT